MVHTCLESTYFEYSGKFYEQVYGVAMGNPLSPIVSNIFMENFESVALQNLDNPPDVWYRYVDDCFAVWNQNGAENCLEFLEGLNQLHPTIKFTLEKENEGSLPFLDININRVDTEIGKTVVFCVPEAHSFWTLPAFQIQSSRFYKMRHCEDSWTSCAIGLFR